MINDIGFYDLFLFCFVLCLNNLFPGISLISDLAYDSGMLQSELFTCRSQNLVLAKLLNFGFLDIRPIFQVN